MGSSNKIAKGFIWTTLANIINGLYGFISVPILIAYFGKTNYGLIGLAMSINVYLGLMDLGLSSTNVRFFSNWLSKGEHEKVNRLFQTSISFYGIIGIVNALVLFIISFFSQSLFHLEPEQDIIIKHLLYILAISAFISWFTSCFDQFIRANEYVGWTQKLSLLPKVLQILILIITVTMGLSIEAYYLLTTFSLFIIIPFMVTKIKKIYPTISFSVGFDKDVFKEILPYTLNIFSFGIFQFSVINLRPVLLGIRGTIESIADYRVLNGIVSIVLMIGGAFLSIILPSASRIVASNNRSAFERVAYEGTQYITIVLCFCCFGVMSIGAELVRIYVGESYLYLLPWLDLWLLTTLATHNQAISSLILSGTDIRAITYTTMASSVIGLLICWFTIPKLQIGGAIIGYAFYLVVQLLFFYFYYWPRKMSINSKRVFFKSFLPYLIVGVISCLTAKYLVSITSSVLVVLLIKGLVFSVVFFMGIVALLGRTGVNKVIGLLK